MTWRRGRATRLLLTATPALLLAVGCGSQQAGHAPAGTPGGSVSPSARATPGGQQPDPVAREAAVADQARQAGAAPTDKGLSLARQAGKAVSYLWETTNGKVCFGQTSSGAAQEIACGAGRVTPEEKGSNLAALFGPGMGFAESYVVFTAERGASVTSVKYQDQEVAWRLVRRLSPERTGRDVYYVTLPDGHQGWIDVTLRQADGRLTPDRLRVTMGGGPRVSASASVH
ncbi:hypothetical protein ABZY68_08125 [Streptomyces sp. NPDC006482]|uniref:hypothetical protein n=1 Tax=Streptomyces sp. NPDC006482 TaxID=3154306 RepID=UPI0033A75A52